jgi:exodeoxyribonuclease VII large subunit
VAGRRAPTPTAAAAAASPDRQALCDAVAALKRRIARDLRRGLETRAQRLDSVARRLLTPAQRIERQQRELASLSRRMANATRRGLADGARHLAALRNALTHLDPTRVLGRGYSIVRGPAGHVLRSSAGLAPGDALDVTFAEGGAAATVEVAR